MVCWLLGIEFVAWAGRKNTHTSDCWQSAGWHAEMPETHRHTHTWTHKCTEQEKKEKPLTDFSRHNENCHQSLQCYKSTCRWGTGVYVALFVGLLWSVILLHSSYGGNLTADMLIVAQGKTNVFVCVWVSHWWWEKATFGKAGSDLYLRRGATQLLTSPTHKHTDTILSTRRTMRSSTLGWTTAECP